MLLSALDMMIAAQAVAADAMLVAQDRAISRTPDRLRDEHWSGDLIDRLCRVRRA